MQDWHTTVTKILYSSQQTVRSKAQTAIEPPQDCLGLLTGMKTHWRAETILQELKRLDLSKY